MCVNAHMQTRLVVVCMVCSVFSNAVNRKNEIVEGKKEYVHLLVFHSEHFARLVLKFGGRNSHLSISSISEGDN